ILVGATAIAAMVSRVFVGKMMQRYSEKNMMMSGALLSIFCFISYATFHSFWPLLLARIFHGIAFGMLHTAAVAYAVTVIPSDHLGRGIGYFMLGPNLALAIGAPCGMLLINHYSFTVFFLCGAIFSVPAFLLSLNVKKPGIIVPANENMKSDGFLIEWKIVAPSISIFLQTFTFGALAAFFPVYALQCGSDNPGLLFSANAIMIIAARTIGGRTLDAFSRKNIMQVFIIVTMAAMIVLFFSKTTVWFVLAGLIWGMGNAFFNPACMAYALDYAENSSGTAVGTFQVFMDLGMALGPVATGVFISFTGYKVMFAFLAFLCLVNLLYFRFFVMKRARRTAL
ncbi:MAG TPA: MFS transporter, partial [Syntrophorhabdaceae bacterium]|nr:MFS transporter [Syntrophorhabdaceae bacterium]